MAENTRIEWADHTINFWEGCQHSGPGCDNCYAEARNRRFSGGTAVNWGSDAPRRRTAATNWALPKKWNAQAQAFLEKNGRRQRVFALSLGDWLDNQVPIEWLVDMLDVVFQCQDLDWMLLTKRIGLWHSRMQQARVWLQLKGQNAPLQDWIGAWLKGQPPSNVCIGASICNQEEADRDIPKILRVPAQMRFLSMEPLLGRILIPWHLCGDHQPGAELEDTTPADSPAQQIHLVIVGGESGPHARPMLPDWVRSLQQQCAKAKVRFQFKQWGEWGTAAIVMSTGLPTFRQFPDYQTWVNKAPTWVNGGICLDKDGKELRNGADMATARDLHKFPVTIMHKLGKAKTGRLLDGQTFDGENP